VRDWFANGRIPLNSADIGSITPSLGTTQKQFSPFGDSAIYELITQPGGGFGDPISRAPDAVAGDVRSGRLSEADAERVYGVCVSASGIGFDASATTKRRQELLDQRLADSRPPREPCEGHTPVSADAPRAIAGVSLTRDHLACTHCGRHLAPVSGNFRLGCRQLELPLPSISPLFDDPEKEVGEQIVFRQYLCPTCCVALDGDICRPADEPYASFRLSM
jgi:N-methylhydantoinase B